MTQFKSVYGKSTLQTGYRPIWNTHLFHPLSCWVHEKYTHCTELQPNCQTNLPSFPSPSNTFLFETRFLKSLVWSTAVMSTDNTHTQLPLLHIQLWPFPTTGRKITTVLEIPGGSSNFSTHYFHFATGKNGRDKRTRLDRMRRCRNTVVWRGRFLPLPLHLVQINLHIILLVQPTKAARL